MALPEGLARPLMEADSDADLDCVPDVEKLAEAVMEPDWDPEFDWLREVE